MPRKNNKQKRNASSATSGFQSAQITRGHVARSAGLTFVSGAFTFTVNAALFGATNALQAVYRYYRFTKLILTIYPPPTTNNNLIACWAPGLGTISSIDNAIEGEKILCISANTSVPQKLVLDFAELTPGPWKWFFTNSKGDTSENTQGQIFLEGTSSQVFQFTLEAEYEFRYPELTNQITLLSDDEKVLLETIRSKRSPV